MKRVLVGLMLLGALAAGGCGKSTGCPSVAGGVGVCVNGQPIQWQGPKPHMHENGGYYAPVTDLAGALGVKMQVAANRQAVFVGGKPVIAVAQGAKGIHQHENQVFAPIREFAEAAGFSVAVDEKAHTVNITKQ